MLSKTTYASQPYQVGRKGGKSLAFIIPAKIVREYNINTSTIIAINIDKNKNSIMLQLVDSPYQKDMIHAGQGFQPTSQRVSSDEIQ